MNLSLIIPCYNESENLPALVARCAELMEDSEIEVIFVDNGSTDATPTVLKELIDGKRFARSVRVEVNTGYGAGILAGLRASHGDIVGWTHADMQTDPCDAIRALAVFETVSDPQHLFVKGKRQGRPLADALFTAGMSLFETILLGHRLRDINAQPTLFHRTFLEKWQSPPEDFSLDLYAYYQARRQRFEIGRIPVKFGDRLHGQSHWNVDWKSKFRFIKRTVMFSLTLRKKLGK